MVEERAGARPWQVWCGWAACVVGVVYALVSGYWAVGGTAGLDTIGGALERGMRGRETALVAVVWVTVGLKLVGAGLGLAVVQEWGRRVPRGLLSTLAWGATAVLVVYGGALVVGQALVQSGVFGAEPADPRAFHWHLFLWDPWFLVWGLLLGAATVGFTRRGRTR